MAEWMEKFNKVLISDIETPKPGRIVYPESWWVVSPDREVFFFCKNGHESPQTNQNKAIVDRWVGKFPGCTVQKLPCVYLLHNCENYV